MQTQISYNTSMLEANRRHASDLEQAVGLLRADMNGVVNALNATRAELQARPLHQDNTKHDTGDLEVLAAQVATIGNKARDSKTMGRLRQLSKTLDLHRHVEISIRRMRRHSNLLLRNLTTNCLRSERPP
ncbi:hypothetical protein KC318_g9186 [Hortaea werneckii]|nr:hypothetical protein KC318_g9186 [Hortaea werneckii]